MSSIQQPATDPIPLFAREVLALYERSLPEVRFPDLDLSQLTTLADELRAAQLVVERAADALEAARAAARDQAQRLNTRCERALAYARVFVSDDPTLSTRIAELDRASQIASQTAPFSEGTQPKRRGRRKKGQDDANLFAETPTSTETSAPPVPAADQAA